jgi:ribosomal protein RSM22 (predicted rRNA methylase)
VIFGNVLNELFATDADRIEKRQRLVTALVDSALTAGGFLILIEPAMKESSRELLRLRDRLLDTLPLSVYSPCIHSGHCPAISPGNRFDWCHENAPWQAPWWVQQIDQRRRAA